MEVVLSDVVSSEVGSKEVGSEAVVGTVDGTVEYVEVTGADDGNDVGRGAVNDGLCVVRLGAVVGVDVIGDPDGAVEGPELTGEPVGLVVGAGEGRCVVRLGAIVGVDVAGVVDGAKDGATVGCRSVGWVVAGAAVELVGAEVAMPQLLFGEQWRHCAAG